jgi:hypothetical protein
MKIGSRGPSTLKVVAPYPFIQMTRTPLFNVSQQMTATVRVNHSPHIGYYSPFKFSTLLALDFNCIKDRQPEDEQHGLIETVIIRLITLFDHLQLFICIRQTWRSLLEFKQYMCLLTNLTWSCIVHFANWVVVQGRTVHWGATQQGSNPGARTFSWDFPRTSCWHHFF